MSTENISDKRKIYDAANGRCELCGRKIEFEEMTVDQIIPLGRGGMDEFNNLQSACFACNQFKKNIHPEEFNKRITEIFLYQMEKRFGKLLKWKILYMVLTKMS